MNRVQTKMVLVARRPTTGVLALLVAPEGDDLFADEHHVKNLVLWDDGTVTLKDPS